MWEIVSLSCTVPEYDGAGSHAERTQRLSSGFALSKRTLQVISRCWHADPDRMPEFQTLRRDLAQLLEDNMNGHYVDLESFASECTD
ncbi:Protein kinase domain-containing protein [Camponotus japonicus]